MEGKSVVAHFDGVAESYDQVLPFFASFAEEAVRRIDPAPGAKALDLAAGRGAFTRELLALGCDIAAVDGSPRMIELLERDYPDVESKVMDAGNLEFPPDVFDLVVCGFAIHIIADPYATLAEAIRVARPGACLAFTVPGRADGEPDPWPDPLVDLYAEYRRFQADGFGRLGNDVEESDLFAQSTLTEVAATTLEVTLPVPDGETYWLWSRSHGSGRFIDGLRPDKRAEMHDRLVEQLDGMPDFMLRRSATLWMARKP